MGAKVTEVDTKAYEVSEVDIMAITQEEDMVEEENTTTFV
jgi:hypothetical protein